MERKRAVFLANHTGFSHAHGLRRPRSIRKRSWIHIAIYKDRHGAHGEIPRLSIMASARAGLVFLMSRSWLGRARSYGVQQWLGFDLAPPPHFGFRGVGSEPACIFWGRAPFGTSEQQVAVYVFGSAGAELGACGQYFGSALDDSRSLIGIAYRQRSRLLSLHY